MLFPASLISASRLLAEQPELQQGLLTLLNALRTDLELDRAGIFAYDPVAQHLERVVGVDPRGQPEFEGDVIPVVPGSPSPILRVARREVPYYLTDDAPRDHPAGRWTPGVRSVVIVPILAGDALLGCICADNCLSGRPIGEEVIGPLYVYAGLAALPLFARYRRGEESRIERLRREIQRDMLFAVSAGRIRLCDSAEIEAEWPAPQPGIPLVHEDDVGTVRARARVVAREAGMDVDRGEDFALCASEAATNALVHGRGGSAALAAHDGRLRVRVTDWGTGIDAADLPRATLQKGWSRRNTLGLGFTVLKEVADCIYLHTGEEGTTVIVEMLVQPPPPAQGSCFDWTDTLARDPAGEPVPGVSNGAG